MQKGDNMKDFRQLFEKELQDVYNMERQVVKALPNIIHGVADGDLKETVSKHFDESKEQITRLETVAASLEINLVEKECEPIQALVKEASKILHASYAREVKDAALISILQRVEHYEIAAYGTLRAFACHLKFDQAEKLFNESIKEEGHADKALTRIAEGTLLSNGINQKACKRKCA